MRIGKGVSALEVTEDGQAEVGRGMGRYRRGRIASSSSKPTKVGRGMDKDRQGRE